MNKNKRVLAGRGGGVAAPLQRIYWWILYPALLLTTFLSMVDLWSTLLENNGSIQVDVGNPSTIVPPKTTTTTTTVIMPQKPDETTYPGLLAESNPFYYHDNNYIEPEDYLYNPDLDPITEGKEPRNEIEKTPFPTLLLSTEFTEKLEQERARLLEETRRNNNNKYPPPLKEAHWTLAKPNPSSPNVTFASPTLSAPKLRMTKTSQTVVMVMSAPDNYVRRQAIRQTWKKSYSNVVFILGQAETAKNTTSFLQHEQDLYQDLVEIPMLDTYKLLPEKVVQAYAWALETLEHVEWFIKVDDDNFVNLQSLEQYLKKYNSNLPMLIGKIVPNSMVAKEGKWADHEYPKFYYPYWPQGSCGHVVTKAVAKYVVQHSSKLHRYQGEDVSLGIWLDEAKELQDDLTYIQAESIMTFDGIQFCYEPQYVIVGHDLTPDAMLQCYQLHQERERLGSTMPAKKEFWVDSPFKAADEEAIW